MELQITYVPTTSLMPYDKNAKRHPAKQVKLIANSIKEFGFQQPIVVDKNNIVIIGHGRLLAAKRLRLPDVPVVRAESLTEEQVRALRLADNKVAESEWNNDFLALELKDLSFDMSDFGFDMDLFNEEDQEEEPAQGEEEILAPPCQHNVFENQELRQFPIENYYGIPCMLPTQTTGNQLLRFMDWNEVDDPQNYIAHFFYDDYKFMSAWREPDKYLERLRKFKAVIAPDFSSYTDFPIVLQILGAYRRNWCGAYWQEQGIDVIPDVQWGDEETYNWCFEGIPKHSTVAVSSLGVLAKGKYEGLGRDLFRKGWDQMMERLEPTAILLYGDMIDGCEGNIIRCPSYYEQKRAMLNKQKEVKDGKGKK